MSSTRSIPERSNTGDTYSYGAAGSTDRALGGLRSGSLIPLFGACFTNNTGAPIVFAVDRLHGRTVETGHGGASRPD